MTFQEMIVQLDDKHRAIRNSRMHIEYYSTHGRLERINQRQGAIFINHKWTQDEKNATDWIIEKIEE